MFAAVLLLGGLAIGQADSAANPINPADVRRLVRQLDADLQSERDAAEQKLLDFGPDVLPLLPQITPATPAETQVRLKRLQLELQRQQSLASVQATHVTGTFENRPVSQVLAAIEKQTGNAIVDHRQRFGQQAEDPVVTLEFDKTPFWQALDETLDAANLAIYEYAAQNDIRIVNRPEGYLPRRERAVYAGPFRFEAAEVVALRDARTIGKGTLRVGAQIAWEPRLEPIALKQFTDALSVESEGGAPITVSRPGATLEPEVTRGSISAELGFDFVAPSRDVQKLANLQGSVVAMLPGRREKFRFDEVKPGGGPIEKRIGGAVVTLDSVRKNNDLWEVRMRVRFDEASSALESHRSWVYQNLAYLIGPEEKMFDPAGFETTRRTEAELGVAYLFDQVQNLAGHAFVYETPTLILSVPVEFEFEDIGLP